MRRKALLAWCALLAAAVVPARAAVTVEGRNLLVDGAPYTIKGVCYQPTPVGYNNTTAVYAWWNDAPLYTADLALLKAMGANTVRVYDGTNMSAGFLDAASAQGIRVVMGYYVDPAKINPPDTAMMDGFVSMIQTWKSHPAVLMWMFGNEVIYPLSASNSDKTAWYTCLSSACVRAHAEDSAHPVGTAHQGIGDIGSVYADSTTLSALDVWGINVYDGPSFGNTFAVMAASTTKPYFFTEWGADAYNSLVSAEDERMQSECVAAQWGEIAANLAVNGKTCSGGTVFEWSDEWWKNWSDTGADDPNHDIIADWTNTDYSDPGMQEEWWGIVAITSGTTTRRLRLAYYALQDAWNPPASSTTTARANPALIIQGPVHSYPNPFRAGADAATIEITVNGTPEITAEIYELTGRKVCSLRDITISGDDRILRWGGADSEGDTVPAGLYVCKITAKAGGREETKFRKIAVIQ